MKPLIAGGAVLVALTVVGLWIRFRRQRRIAAELRKLAGKVVVITGASSGLGEACAHTFYAAGCRVIICARTVGELLPVKSDIEKRQLPSTVATYEVKLATFDLGDPPGIATSMKEALGFYGHVDILVNNGGISYRGTIAETVIDVDISLMNINYFGAVAVTKAVLPSMIKRKCGHIVAISSVQGKLAIPFRSAYTASKHAIQSFFDTLRAEVAEHGIHVTVISPAYIRTALSLNAMTATGGTHGKMDATTSSGMSAEHVSQIVLHSIVAQQNELLLAPFLYRLTTYLRNILPDLYFYAMAKRAKSQTGLSKKDS